jgi:urea transporter/murein DD-endopeptidase MepM/ murein hydrolase activator NlpD
MMLLQRLGQRLAPLARAYAGVFFCESPWVGIWFAVNTWWSPHSAAAGLAALLAAAVWGRLLALNGPGRPHLLNSLLVGLVMGAFHVPTLALVGWIVLAALVTTLIAHWFAGLLWRWGRLPVLSLPFVLASWLVLLTIQGQPTFAFPMTHAGAGAMFTPWMDHFFVALGWLMLVPYPLAGALLFVGLLVASRYLAVLAIAGYVAGHAILLLMHQHGVHAFDYNFVLAAMALGGVFVIPGRASFILALAGGALAAVLAVAQGTLLLHFHLPLLTLPFIVAVYIWLGALSARGASSAPYLILESPAVPELSIERMRLAHTRGGDPAMPALQPPFHGEWQVSQGFNGPHTHRGEWQHALDFHIVEEGRSFRGAGVAHGDYFCFGAPVLAPTSGQIVRVRDDLPDVLPGEADVTNNWGNFVLLRSDLGYYVILSHLRQSSLKVQVGQWVQAGQQLAACGSSGRSPEPHLHMHVQDEEWLGCPTRPFHLTNVLVRTEGNTEFHLYKVPTQGTRLAAAPRNAELTIGLHIQPGRVFSYKLQGSGAESLHTAQLRSELTLLGQSRLVADNRMSAAFVETPTVIGYFDRQGRRHTLLDMWLLAVGLTPLSLAAENWRDRPGLHLLPLSPLRRLLVVLLKPFGAACDSRYRRCWEEESHAWRQEGEHRVRLAPGIEWKARTTAWITPNSGIHRLQLTMFDNRWEAVLEDCGWVEA